MNTFLKQELPGLIPLSVVQIWLCFNYAPWVWLASPLNWIVPIAASLVTVAFLFYVFSFPEMYRRQLNLEFFDHFPCPEQSKTIFKVCMQAIFHTIILYLWYSDFHRCTNIWYAVWYVYCMATFILFSRAFRRYEKV